MIQRFSTGLVVGKFCPLHRGHELLIGEAVARCDEVVVISYTKPEFRRCEPAARERWIAELFPTVRSLIIDDERLESICAANGIGVRILPHNDASDDDHRAFVAWLCESVLGTSIDAVFTSEDYGDGFAGALTKHFRGQSGSQRQVRHVSVDRDRQRIPVSGTAVRSDPCRQREYLAPAVYANFVRRIAILGGESSGKTTLAQALAAHFGTRWIPEYGRELWEQRNGILQFEDMIAIASVQVEREERLARGARSLIFCDTTPLTTAFYSQDMFGHVDPALEQLAARDYDYVLLCASDFPFLQDGTRRTPEFRVRQYRWYVGELQRRRLPFLVVAGSLAQRVSAVVSRLQSDRT